MQLAVEGVCVAYGTHAVLDDVTFTLEPQAKALLLGPSGSGKSTLLNVICGLHRPDAGIVTLGNKRIVGSGAADGDEVRRQSMGIIFQTLRLVSALDLRANLMLAQKLQTGHRDEALVETTMEQLGIAHRAAARPHQLSQGEAQRAAIARALVVKPRLLIADEPTSALDNANTQTVATLLLDLAQEVGASLLVATHDERLKAHFKQSMTLDEGRIAA